MGIRSDKEIYRALETRLREAQKPITCVDLMDDPDFRATAIAEYGKDIRVTTNKVSNALGLMWRRNLLATRLHERRVRWRVTLTSGTRAKTSRS